MFYVHAIFILRAIGTSFHSGQSDNQWSSEAFVLTEFSELWAEQGLNIKHSEREKKNPSKHRPFLLCDALLHRQNSLFLCNFWCCFAKTFLCCKWITCYMQMVHLVIDSVLHLYTNNILCPLVNINLSSARNSTVCFPQYEHWNPWLPGKTCLMFMVFECVDLADMLSLWCCNPVSNSVLYLLVGI